MVKHLEQNLFNWKLPVESRILAYNDARTIHALSMEVTHLHSLRQIQDAKLEQQVAECAELVRFYGNRVHQAEQQMEKVLQFLKHVLQLADMKGLTDQLKECLRKADLTDCNDIPF